MKMSVFRGGVPYEIDVKRLKEALPVESLTEGRVITHSDLAGILDFKVGSQRYYGVVNSWMSEMKNQHAIVIVWQATVGVKVLTANGVLAHGEKKMRQKISQTVRSTKWLAWVKRERLDEREQRRLDNHIRVATAIQDALGNARKQLVVELPPVQSMPRRRLAEPTEKGA